jgi:hypothetical protein
MQSNTRALVRAAPHTPDLRAWAACYRPLCAGGPFICCLLLWQTGLRRPKIPPPDRCCTSFVHHFPAMLAPNLNADDARVPWQTNHR